MDFEEKYEVFGASKEYNQKMRQSGEWGTDMELQVAASLYQKSVYVFTQQSSSTRYGWTHYTPTTPMDVQRLPKHLELCHTNNNHFDCIVNERH